MHSKVLFQSFRNFHDFIQMQLAKLPSFTHHDKQPAWKCRVSQTPDKQSHSNVSQ